MPFRITPCNFRFFSLSNFSCGDKLWKYNLRIFESNETISASVPCERKFHITYTKRTLKHSDFIFQGTHTGVLFIALLADLVQLNNDCENGCLTLEQLPLVEQIPVVHRLDHSVHTARLYIAGRCRQLAATWNVAQFYCTAHTDITKCLDVLNKLEVL